MNRGTDYRLSIFALSIATMLMCVATETAFSRPGEKFEQAMRAYSNAQYDDAITILLELAGDSSMEQKDRVQVHLHLGRAYVAKNLYEKAKWSIAELLELEPPAISLDPDNECPPLMKIYYDVRKEKAGSAQIERSDPGIQTIAILDFMNRSVDDKEKFDPMEKGFSELMINQLQGTVKLKVVERERIQWILEEIGLENEPGKFDPASAVRVGKQLGVHTVLLGSFIKLKDQIKLLARLVKVETSEILATEEATGDADDFFELTEKLGVKVAGKINVAVTREDLSQGTETKSLDAMMSYSEGLVLLEKGNYKLAYDKFLEAVEKDPAYEKAKTKAESLRPLIG
ncbi:MAG: CsgG/HfaB family protein [Bacteroidota bacterium]